MIGRHNDQEASVSNMAPVTIATTEIELSLALFSMHFRAANNGKLNEF